MGNNNSNVVSLIEVKYVIIKSLQTGSKITNNQVNKLLNEIPPEINFDITNNNIITNTNTNTNTNTINKLIKLNGITNKHTFTLNKNMINIYYTLKADIAVNTLSIFP